MIRTVDILDEVIEFCITDRFKERGNGIASIRDIEPKTLIRLRAAILIEVADIRMSRAAVMIGMQPASLWMWIKRKMGEYKHDKELAKRRYECLQRKYNLKPDYDYLMLVPRAEPTKHDEQGTRPAKFLGMEVSAREVAAMADAMASAVAFMERFCRGQRLGETQGLHRLIKAWNYDRD